MTEPFVGIQIGAISFVDEGVEPVLDRLQETAGVNALLISALSWSIGNAGRAAYGFPDHGVQELDHLQGGAFFEPDEDYYQATFHKQFKAPDPLYEGFDTLADVIPAARTRRRCTRCPGSRSPARMSSRSRTCRTRLRRNRRPSRSRP